MACKPTELENKALQQLKNIIKDALNDHQLTSYEGEAATVWGVPLLGDPRSELVVLKFLKAKGFQVMDAFGMIKDTLRWRKEVGVDTLSEEDLGNTYDRVLFTHGCDREGYPVWYFVLGELQNTMLCCTCSEVENQHKFYCWLIQFVEKTIKMYDFSTGSRNSFVLVIDLEILPWHRSRDLYKVIYQFLQLLHDYYPEFLEKQLWINASWWYRYYCRVYCLVFDSWSMNKTVVFTGSSKTTATLFKYISPGQIPVKYGGLSNDRKQELIRINTDEPVSEDFINPGDRHTLEFNFAEICDVLWDLKVIGWDICYGAEFVPRMKGKYITIIAKSRKLTATDGLVISDSFSVTEPGKLVLKIHNVSSKKKKLLARVRVTAPGGSRVGDEASLRGWLVQPND